MAMYKNLRRYSDDEAAWISQRLISLRQTIRASDLGRLRVEPHKALDAFAPRPYTPRSIKNLKGQDHESP